jgi:phosphoribosylglycinamide formyltransferase-1
MESKEITGASQGGITGIVENSNKSRIAIFASGRGTNADAIMDYFQHALSAEVVLLLSNNPEALVLQRAKNYGVAARVFTKEQFYEKGQVLTWLQESKTTHVVLAGFLWHMPLNFIHAFANHMINIHPSLLPKFGGKGMYGMRVHEAVRTSGAKETGITIHVVNENYDEGKILFQAKCAVDPTDTPEQIAQKVHQLEYDNYPKVIEQWVQGSERRSSPHLP